MHRRTQLLICSLATALCLSQSAYAGVPEGLFGPPRTTKPQVMDSINTGNEGSKEALQALLQEGGKPTEHLSEEMLDGYAIADMEAIPSPRMIAVEDERTGKMGFLSANGRYFIEGTIVDLWNGKHLKTVQDVRDSRQQINAQALDFPSKATFTFGKGSKDVVIFSDPHCDICQDLLTQAEKIAEASEEFKFNVVVVPAMGKTSLPAVQKMWCAGASEAELLRASVKGDVSGFKDKAECNFEKMGSAFVSADMLGVDAVPTIIAPDGHLARGLNTSLGEYLSIHGGESK